MLFFVGIILLSCIIVGLRFKTRNQQSVRRIFEETYDLLRSEQVQNLSMPISLQAMLKENDFSRAISGGYGFSPYDPVRVNGPIGELIYLSCLRSKGDVGFIGHRLGSFNALDVFEIVSEDLSSWHILYMDMYWRQKDLFAPHGLSLFSQSGDSSAVASGLSVTNRFLRDFPRGFWPQLLETTQFFLGIPAVRLSVKEIDQSSFSRPIHHEREVQRVVVMQRAQGLGQDS